jgi:DNA-binding response OmpR family regulator
MKVLIAEDDLTSRNVLSAILKKEGCEVQATVNGVQALEAMRQPDAPKLAILDWMMPEMDGVEVCRQLSANKAEQPPYLIILTTRDKKEDIVAGLAAGANDYLTKPFSVAELRARIGVGRRMLEVQAQLASTIAELREAANHIKTLRGIVPICAKCKKIRDDKGYWERVEVYVARHSEAQFSHGLCPDCMQALYPGLELKPRPRPV